jgi:multidrug efflux pump subunit AcrB
MVKYLIQRPIAVLMSFIALVISGLIMIWKVPVSLLPDADVPQIVIRVNYPDAPAARLEANVLRFIREGLVNTAHVTHVESRAANHTGLIYLTFQYGTRMDLAFIEVNEKLDRISNNFPKGMQRPQVMRINTADIPVIRLQVTPKNDGDYLAVSALAEKVLKKRLEQLEGVSLVDINGRQQGIITVIPDRNQLAILGVGDEVIVQAIQNANRDAGGLSLKDGQYRYFVKMGNSISSPEELGQLPVTAANGTVLTLDRVATIAYEAEIPTSYHLYNGVESLVITIQKQPGSRMNDLMPEIKKAIDQFRNDYPQVNFALTQDQSFLLDAGIGNLYQDIIYGGILTIALLFLVLGNWASPVLMSISIPVSLIITFIFFYVFNLSFNIISLSGLALGVGMLIDNSIVVIDSITRKRRTAMPLRDSCVQGTNEVIAPVISQVLTTVAVYAPLILISGIAGVLVWDQSIALSISLGVSLLVAFILVPLLYKLFLKASPEKLKEDTYVYKKISAGYHAMITHILKYRLVYLLATVLLMPAGILLSRQLRVDGLPEIEKKESLVQIDWNEPIDAKENLARTRALQQIIQKSCIVTEAEIGLQQFLLQQESNNIQSTAMYFSCKNETTKIKADKFLKQWLSRHYAAASYNITDAPNAFTQLFKRDQPYFEARFKTLSGIAEDEDNKMNVLLNELPAGFRIGDGLVMERSADILLDEEKMALYGVTRQAIESRLQQIFGTYIITEIKRFGDSRAIRLKTDAQNVEAQFASTVRGRDEVYYQLNNFISLRYTQQPRFITADITGQFRSIVFDEAKNVPALQQQLTTLAASHGYAVDFTGAYFDNQAHLQQLWLIFFIVLFLLYVILAIQYESLVLPVLVMLTIPLGLTGGMFLLWLAGGTLNVMAAIGFVVVLGLIVDDPILKIETLNRLQKKYAAEGLSRSEQLLEKMIHEAGDICLKPLLMVSLTTSIALVPVLFINGIGNDLQKPLAYVIIGGLTLGTFFTSWFIPLAYWYVMKWSKR